MLTPTSELPEQERFDAWGLGWTAIDPDSGAYLFRTNGRSRTTTLPKYILILPRKSVADRRSLFHDTAWDYPHGRKIVRAMTDEEAIVIANERLIKMMEQQASARGVQP
jgi:hypothetical protein